MNKHGYRRLIYCAAVSLLVSGMGVAPLSCGDKQSPSPSPSATPLSGLGSIGYCAELNLPAYEGGVLLECAVYTNPTSADEANCTQPLGTWTTAAGCPTTGNYLGTCMPDLTPGLSYQYYTPNYSAGPVTTFGTAAWTCAQFPGGDVYEGL